MAGALECINFIVPVSVIRTKYPVGLVQWFDGTHLSVSPAQLDFDKFRWVNHHYLKALPGR